MKKLRIDFENCYGIGKLEHTFDFSTTNTFLVYAPNGTMKTSLAKTLAFFGEDNAEIPCDRIYPDRVSKHILEIDGVEVTSKENILVVNHESSDYDSSHKISTFLASKDLKKKYDDIYTELNTKKTEFIKKLKATSQSTDCEAELLEAFTLGGKDTLFDLLYSANSLLTGKNKKYIFKYNDIFDKKKNVKKFLEKNEPFLDQYIVSYRSLLSSSTFFKESKNSFGTYQAGEIIKSIDDNSFFDAGHVFELSGNVRINSAEKLQELVESEISKIINDEKLKEIFRKIDSAIGSNIELRAFKKVIEKDNSLLVELKDYEEFKKRVWLGYLGDLKSETNELCNFYSSKKKELEVILAEACKEVKIWKDLVEKFNSRFYVPFEVKITNQEDIILKQDGANLTFSYSDRNDGGVEKDKHSLLKTLSKGEQKAYYILQLLFDVESRKIQGNDTVIVFDDVADSFDYKNKYAIVEYIKDLKESDDFKILILTHNFDFYRTVASRLYLDRKIGVLMAVKNNTGEVTLKRGEYVKDIFKHLSGRITEPRVFIALVPFLRNLVEYTEDDQSNDYALLTKCLHLKDGSELVTVSEVIDIWKTRYGKYNSEVFAFDKDKIIELIHKTAELIVSESTGNFDEVLLENKIVLSIATRLKAEEFMINFLNSEGVDLTGIDSDQTSKLFIEYKKSSKADQGKIRMLDKVILMTPENIHLNAFMYEPLIDMSIWHLVELYNGIKTL